MAFEVIDGHEVIGFGYSAGDEGLVDVFSVHGHGCFVSSFKAVGYDDRRIEHERVPSVMSGAECVGHGLAALTHIQCGGIGEKRLGSCLAQEIKNRLDPERA